MNLCVRWFCVAVLSTDQNLRPSLVYCLLDTYDIKYYTYFISHNEIYFHVTIVPSERDRDGQLAGKQL